MENIMKKEIVNEDYIKKENLEELYAIELKRNDFCNNEKELDELTFDSECVKKAMKELEDVFDNNFKSLEILMIKRKKYLINVECVDLCVYKRYPVIELRKCKVMENGKTFNMYLKHKENKYFDANDDEKTEIVISSELISRLENERTMFY